MLLVVSREDFKRVISSSSELDKEKQTPRSIVKLMGPFLESLLKDESEVLYELAGENKDTTESILGLIKSFMIAFLGIYFVLVFLFGTLTRPMIIFTAIPFGMVGVIWAFTLFNEPLGFMALMGIVALVGVVVND